MIYSLSRNHSISLQLKPSATALTPLNQVARTAKFTHCPPHLPAPYPVHCTISVLQSLPGGRLQRSFTCIPARTATPGSSFCSRVAPPRPTAGHAAGAPSAAYGHCSDGGRIQKICQPCRTGTGGCVCDIRDTAEWRWFGAAAGVQVRTRYGLERQQLILMSISEAK